LVAKQETWEGGQVSGVGKDLNMARQFLTASRIKHVDIRLDLSENFHYQDYSTLRCVWWVVTQLWKYFRYNIGFLHGGEGPTAKKYPFEFKRKISDD
jgi:hypothetical protein